MRPSVPSKLLVHNQTLDRLWIHGGGGKLLLPSPLEVRGVDPAALRPFDLDLLEQRNLIRASEPEATRLNWIIPVATTSFSGYLKAYWIAGAAALTLSFVVGIFPETGLLFIIESLRSSSPSGVLARYLPSVQEEHPLTNLEGIDLYDRARLLDEGIANIEALAHHDLIDLMLETRFPVPRLVDWIDQAVLYLHTAGVKMDGGGQLRAQLRQFGIRTATDLETCLKAAREREAEEAFLVEASRDRAATDRLERAASSETSSS